MPFPIAKGASDDGGIFEDVKSSDVIDLTLIVFRQIDRCNVVMIQNPSLLKIAVMGLQAIIAPRFKPEDFIKLDAIDEEYEKIKAAIAKNEVKDRQGHTVKDASVLDAFLMEKEFQLAIKRYSTLLNLAALRGFYPETEVVMEI